MTVEKIQPMPVRKGWPLLGILPDFFSGDPFEYLKNIMLEQGDFVRLNFGPQPVYLVSHPDYLQRILRDNYKNYRKPDMFYKLAKEVLGNGLVLNQGDTWLRQRRMIQPHLHRKQLVNLASDMVDAIAEVLNSWETVAKSGTEVELSEKIGEIALHVTVNTMFGKGTLPPVEIAEIGQRIKRIFKYGGDSLYRTLLPDWFPIPGHSQFEKDLNETHKIVSQVIVNCREKKGTAASLIQMLIDAVDEETHEQMTDQQLFDEIMTIFVGGYDTTVSALTWVSVIIQQHPEVLKKMRLEIDNALGTDHHPSMENIFNLTYTRQVFMETMRMHTTLPFLPRALNEADKLGCFDLPAHALVLVFYHGVHHNPKVWDNPEIFDPERFTPERIANRHPFAYVPFSAGPRKCAGEEFALFEGPLAIAMLLQKYNINFTPNQKFPARMGASLQPAHGVKATLSIRNSN